LQPRVKWKDPALLEGLVAVAEATVAAANGQMIAKMDWQPALQQPMFAGMTVQQLSAAWGRLCTKAQADQQRVSGSLYGRVVEVLKWVKAKK
jgi:hypothetical protein